MKKAESNPLAFMALKNETSRFLHDVVAGDLLHFQFLFHKIESQLDEETFIELSDQLTYIRNKVRNYSHNLQIKPTFDKPLFDLIQDILVDYAYILPDVEFTYYKFPKQSDLKHTDILIENITLIIKEAINNAIVHGKSKHIETNIIEHAECISLTIIDNGTGYSLHQTDSGIGTTNIKERVNTLNGSMIMDSTPNKGTSLTFEFPI